MVNPELAGGWRLIDALIGRAIQIDVALWARLSGEEKWILYLASPQVGSDGAASVYRLVHALLRDAPEWGVDPFSVIVLDVNHQMAKAAAEIIKPKVAGGPFAVPNSKPHRGMTRFQGRSLGGIHVDGAYIYPPWEAEGNSISQI